MARTVWILGAGFSRPLGGPLLPELLTPALTDRVRAAFPEGTYPLLHKPVDDTLRIYERHGPKTRKQLWEHAEEYLEFLDAAAYARGREDDATPLVKLWVRLFGEDLAKNPGIVTTAQLARRLMAAECSQFYVDADTSFEKWQPYRRWVGLLAEGDAVLTFNYDTVVEAAAGAFGVKAERLHVVEPGKTMPLGRIPLLKLPGALTGSVLVGRSVVCRGAFFALTDARGDCHRQPHPTKQDRKS
jgi:hypothetical protein